MIMMITIMIIIMIMIIMMITITIAMTITITIMVVVVIVMVTVMMVMVMVIMMVIIIMIIGIYDMKLIQSRAAQGVESVSIYHDLYSSHISLCKSATINNSLKFYFKAIMSFGSLRTARDIVPYNWVCICFNVSGRLWEELRVSRMQLPMWMWDLPT